ncbi:MAG: hypothetical protein GQ527_04275, partial [Bacteroidales bacterium]|nr:hypothetical protein [Bacteroidales bacterium]
MLLILLMFSTSFYSSQIIAQSDICEESEAFCTAEAMNFPAGVDNGTAMNGPDYGCLGSQPNPAWFHMLIDEPGSIQIDMFSKPLEDIDFICWGPFVDPTLACDGQLTTAKIVDCSYSPNATETCNIPNAQVGEYYILMITNFSNRACNITFSQDLGGGGGQTDCSIVAAQVDNNGPVCVGDTLKLFGETLDNTTYAWTGPDGFTSNLQSPEIPNAQIFNTGIYSLIITQGSYTSEPAVSSAVVVPLPNIEIANANDYNETLDTFRLCFGEEMRFHIWFNHFTSATWNNGSTGPNTSPYNTSGPVIVVGENSTGCINHDTAYLDIQDEIIFSLDLPDFCDGEDAAIITNDVDLVGGEFTGDAVSFSSPEYTLDPALITVGDSAKTYYTYTALYSCFRTDSVWTKHYALPSVNLNLDQNSICVDADAITLSGGSPASGNYLGTGVSAGDFDPSIPGVGVFDIKYGYKDLHNCSDTATDQMTVFALPIVTFDLVPPFCPNSGIITIDQGDPEGNGGVGNYS